MLKIAIILGSTRPGRNGEAVAKWVHEVAYQRSDAEFELVDIKDLTCRSSTSRCRHPWDNTVSLTPKHGPRRSAVSMPTFSLRPSTNHGIPGALKNAIDFLFAEWNNKAAGFVSYGGVQGVRAVEQLRLVLAEVQIATVRNQVLLSLFTDFENYSVFKPGPTKEQSVNDMLDQLIAWGGALKTLRKTSGPKGEES